MATTVDLPATEPAIFRGPTTAPLSSTNVGLFLDEQCLKSPEKIAVRSKWQQSEFTFQQLRNSCHQVAASLLDHGVRPKDRIFVLAGNAVEYVQLFFAVGSIGAILCIINPTFTAEEVVDAVDLLEPAAIFVAKRIGYRKNEKLLADLVQRRSDRQFLVQLDQTPPVGKDVLGWDTFRSQRIDKRTAELLSQCWGQSHADDPFCIQFTSGTTGPRKAAMLSHASLLNNAYLVGQRLNCVADDIVCCSSPLFHCFGLVCGLLLGFAYNNTIVLPSDVFLPDATLRALSEDGCTVLHAVSTMFFAMLDDPCASMHAPKMRLRTGIIAGSSFSKDLLRRLDVEFGFKDLAYGYGMTEFSCIAFLTTPSKESLMIDNASVGSIMAHAAAKVLDSDLRPVGVDEPGELLVSGPFVFRGYFRNPEKTQEATVTDRDGTTWLRTGDLARLDSAGRCTIIGRVKDMIKKGGENIYPSDIEKVLEEHPAVRVAAVVGVPDVYWGEVICAFVQREDQGSAVASVKQDPVGNKQIKAFLRSRLAAHKMPDRFLWIGDAGVPAELPINVTGKLEKARLRAVATELAKVKRIGTEST